MAATVRPFEPSFVFSGEIFLLLLNKKIVGGKKCLAKNNLWRKNNFWQLAVDSWQVAVDSWQVAVDRWQLAGGSWQVVVSRWQVEGGMWPNCLGAVRKAGIRCLHWPLG